MLETGIKVTPELAADHGLTAEEYARVLAILGREPNLTELGIFSVMWSEHCSYKSSKVYLRRLPTRGPQVLQGPGENAGVVEIGDGLCAVFKIESHNHPSYVEPFQGAATGVGGILRDIFTMGARPIAVLDALRFGPIVAHDHASPEAIRRNRRILDGVVSGIAFYGNCFGVPTVGGEVQFEPCYAQNPLVNVLALGIARKEDLFFARARGVGNPVIYVGAKTGRDGIHGASLLASAEFTEESKQKRPNVQVGDPFFEKKLLHERVADLHVGAFLLRLLGEFSGGEQRGTMNSVAARFCPDVNHRIADAFGFGKKDFFLFGNAERERIDERILRIARLEGNFAADGGNAETVSVASDAANDAVEDAAVFRGLFFRRVFARRNFAEAERIENGDGTRSHGENVAQDAADARRRALKRLNITRMIVRFDFERDDEAVADVDDAGVFSRALHHELAACGQALQVDFTRFIGAVLAPHHAEDAQLGDVRVAA